MVLHGGSRERAGASPAVPSNGDAARMPRSQQRRLVRGSARAAGAAQAGPRELGERGGEGKAASLRDTVPGRAPGPGG